MKVKSPPRDADVRTSELPQRPAMRSEVEENATENVYDSTLHTLSHSFKAMCTLEGASDSCMLIESTEISHGHGHGDMPTQAHTHTQDGVDSKARSSKGSLLSIRLVVNRDHILTSYDRATDSTTVVPTGGAGHTLPPNRATPMQKTRSFGDDANRWGALRRVNQHMVNSQSMDHLAAETDAYRPELSITRDTADSPLLMSPAVAESSCHGNLRAAHGVGHGSSDTWVTCVNHLLSRIPLPPVPTFSQFAESAVALECGSEDKNGSETTHEGHGKGLHSREKRPIVGHKSKEHHVYRTAAALSDEAQIIALTTRSDACDDVRYQSPGPHATDDTEKEGEEHNKTTHREVGGRTVGEAQDTDRPAHAGKDGECTDTASAQIARGTTHNATHGSKHSTNIYGSKHSTHKGGEGSADAAQATGESVYVFKGTQISDCVQIGADTIEVTRSLRDSEATLSAAQRLDAALIVEAKHGKGSTKESTQGSVHGSIQYYTTAHTRYTSHARDMHLVPDCRASRSEGDTAHVCADSELDFTRAHMGEASQDIQRSRASTSPTRACGPQATESVQLRETQRFRYYREKERLMYQNTLERNNDATPKFGQPAFPLAMNIYCTRTQSLPLGRTCAGADVQPLNTRSPHAHRGKGAERQTQMQRPKNVNGQGRGRSVLSSRANKFKCKNDKQCVPVDRRRRIKTDRQKTTNKYTPTHTHATAERCTEAPHSATDQEHTVHKHTTPHPNTVPHSHSAAHKSVTRHGQPGASASRHPTRDTHSTRRMHSTADEGAGTQDTACSAATAKTATTPPYKPSRPTVRFAPTPDKAYKKSRIPAFSTPEKVRNYRSTPSKQKENKPPPIKTPGVSSKDKAIAPGNTPKKCATFEGTCLQLALSPADKPLPSAHIKRHSQTQTKRPSQTTANGRRRTPLADTDNLPSVTCTYSQTSKYVQAMGSCHPGRHGDVIVSNVCDVEMITKTVRKRPKAGDTRLSLGSLSDDDHPATTPTFRRKGKCISRVKEVKA